MANLCLDDVYFYSDEHPERIQELWEDLEASIILSTCKPDDRWFGKILQYKSINTENIYLRGSVCYMTYDNGAILLSLETCWEPLYEAYRVVADTYEFLLSCKVSNPDSKYMKIQMIPVVSFAIDIVSL